MKYNTEKDYIKAVRRANREDEIEYHGKQISLRPTKIEKTKKVYNRKKFRKPILIIENALLKMHY